MNKISVSTPPTTDLFKTETCNIGNGSVIINLRDCDIKINPVITLENAAKLAARQIYQVMEHPESLSQEPEWVNMVTFASEEFEKTPAIRVVDNKLYYNSPPFKKTKKNLNFWKYFTKYWYIMVVKAMERALASRKDKNFFEEEIIHKYSSVDV